MITLNLIDLVLYTLIMMIGVYIIVEWRLRQTLHQAQTIETKIRSVLKIVIDDITKSLEILDKKIELIKEVIDDNRKDTEDN